MNIHKKFYKGMYFFYLTKKFNNKDKNVHSYEVRRKEVKLLVKRDKDREREKKKRERERGKKRERGRDKEKV